MSEITSPFNPDNDPHLALHKADAEGDLDNDAYSDLGGGVESAIEEYEAPARIIKRTSYSKSVRRDTRGGRAYPKDHGENFPARPEDIPEPVSPEEQKKINREGKLRVLRALQRAREANAPMPAHDKQLLSRTPEERRVVRQEVVRRSWEDPDNPVYEQPTLVE